MDNNLNPLLPQTNSRERQPKLVTDARMHFMLCCDTLVIFSGIRFRLPLRCKTIVRRTVQIFVLFQLLNLLGGHIDAVVRVHELLLVSGAFYCNVCPFFTVRCRRSAPRCGFIQRSRWRS